MQSITEHTWYTCGVIPHLDKTCNIQSGQKLQKLVILSTKPSVDISNIPIWTELDVLAMFLFYNEALCLHISISDAVGHSSCFKVLSNYGCECYVLLFICNSRTLTFNPQGNTITAPVFVSFDDDGAEVCAASLTFCARLALFALSRYQRD